MRELTRIRVRTVGWFLLAPVGFLGVLPWWLAYRSQGPFVWDGSLPQWVGIWLLANGAGLMAWCANLFNVEGRGTPAPFDPPTLFVTSGPYRYVRNPMALGAFLALCGETILYGSRAVFLYTLCLIVVALLFVRYVEEPQLERRFGPAYLAYKRQVPRWIPRFPAR